MLKKVYIGLLCCSVLFTASCATIVGDKRQLVQIASSPDGAQVKIYNSNNIPVFSGQTPTQALLDKSDGSYFGGQDYRVVIKKDGYETVEAYLTASMNAWYMLGNLMFGGLIGWLVVDPLNGGMYTLSPDMIMPQLNKNTLSDNGGRGLSVVLLEDIPDVLQGKMVRIN